MKQFNNKLKQEEQLLKQQQQNEQLLAPALEYFQTITIQNSTVIDSLCQIQFFKNNCPEGTQIQDFVVQAAKYVKYEYFTYGQVIFNYGDFGDKMFIILNGQAGVYVPKSQEDIEQEQSQQSLKKSKRMLFIDDALFENRNNPIYFQNGIYLYQKVFQYFSGQCFGDVALTSDKPRSASLITISQTLHCISINRAQFKQMCEKTIQEQQKTLELYSKILPGVQPFSISKFIQNLRPINFVSQTMLWQKGDEPLYLLIIMKGTVEIFTNIEDQRVIQNKYSNYNNFTIKLKKIVLSQVTDGHILGQEELIDDISSRKYNCQCVENTFGYYMEADVFKKIIRNFPDILGILKSLKDQNSSYINQRFHTVLQNIQQYQEQINKEPLQNIEKKSLYDCIDLLKKSSDKTTVLRSQNKKLLTLSQSVKKNKEAFQQKYKDKQPKDFLLSNPELQQNIQDKQERQYYVNTRQIKSNRSIEGRISLSNEIKNLKLSLSKSQSRFQNQTEQNLDNPFILQSVKCKTEVALSPQNLSRKQLQINVSQFTDSQKKKDRLLLQIHQAIKSNNFSYLPFRNMKSLHSQMNLSKLIKTEQSFLNDQLQQQQLFVTSCKNRTERSLNSFPRLYVQESEEN